MAKNNRQMLYEIEDAKRWDETTRQKVSSYLSMLTHQFRGGFAKKWGLPTAKNLKDHMIFRILNPKQIEPMSTHSRPPCAMGTLYVSDTIAYVWIVHAIDTIFDTLTMSVFIVSNPHTQNAIPLGSFRMIVNYDKENFDVYDIVSPDQVCDTNIVSQLDWQYCDMVMFDTYVAPKIMEMSHYSTNSYASSWAQEEAEKLLSHFHHLYFVMLNDMCLKSWVDDKKLCQLSMDKSVVTSGPFKVWRDSFDSEAPNKKERSVYNKQYKLTWDSVNKAEFLSIIKD